MPFADPDAYDQFMGRWSGPLARDAVERLDWDGVRRVLDVGCGPGALTGALVERLGAAAVTSVDPSAPFVEAVRQRHPGVETHVAPAEQLPLPDASYEVVLAQLVVHFMADPLAGLGEMRRVARDGATVAASVWDHATGRGPLSPYWRAAAAVDPASLGEGARAGARPGHLAALLEQAGLRDVQGDEQAVTLTFDTFEEWWDPFTHRVGTAGDHLAGLEDRTRRELEQHCRSELGDGPFSLTSVAWWAQGRA